MKSIYIWITLLVIAGFILALVLIPSEQDVALFDLKGNKYLEAENYYKEQYQKGSRSPDIVIPLATLYQRSGDLNGAIALMEEFTESHPRDTKALQMLADLYQINQQYEHYYQTLLKLKQIDPTKSTLEELAEWYQNANAPGPLFETLKQLVTLRNVDESYYLLLANFYAEKKEYEKARETLEMRRKLYPAKITINDVLFEVWVDAELSKAQGGQPKLNEKAVNLLADFLLEQDNPKIAFYAIGVVKIQYPLLLPPLLKRLEPMIEENQNLEILVLQFSWEDRAKKKAAYAKIIELEKNPPANPAYQNLAFRAFLEQEDDTRLLDLLHKNIAGNIEDRQIIDLAIAAIERNKPYLAKAMEHALGNAYLNSRPVIRTSLAIGAQEAGARPQLDDLIKDTVLTETNLYYLFAVSATAGFEKEALEIGNRLSPYLGLADYQLLNIAQEYVKMQKGDALYPMIQKALPMIGEDNAKPALAVLDIARGHSRAVAEWIKQEPSLANHILDSLYTTAEQSKEYPLALFIAKRLQKDYPSPVADAEYALALVQVGKIDNGIAMLKTLYEGNPSNTIIERSYFDGLVFAVKRNPRYREELIAFMSKRAWEGSVPTSMQRDFAYTYLEDLHDYAKAEQSFRKIAENASPESSDVETLVYLWGPKPSDEKVAWLEKRAFHSNHEQLGFWLGYLNFVGKPCIVIDLFERRMDWCFKSSGIKAYFAYMDALAYEKRKIELHNAIDYAFPLVQERKQLERLAGYAEEAEYSEARILIWQRIAFRWPYDPIPWQKLAKAAFDEHDNTLALIALNQFFELALLECKPNEKLYESLYEYAEVLYKRRHFGRAKDFYLFALEEIKDAGQPTEHMLEIKSLITYKLETHRKALRVMHQAYSVSGRDPEVAASYANMLMDNGHLECAKKFLKTQVAPSSKCTTCSEELWSKYEQ